MEYLVCKNKDDGSLFITTRASRETMLSVMQGLSCPIESVVLKSFSNYTLAFNYKAELENVDKTLNKLIKP